MQSVTHHLLKFGDKYWNAIQISGLIAIFCYFFAENFILSESWEVLALRSVDDYAMNESVHQMQEALISGHWKRVFTFFDYGYGNAFWLINAILLLPLHMVGDAQLQIVVGRQISLFYVFGSIYLAGLIIDQIRPSATYLKYPILITIAIMPMVSIIGTKLHVNSQCLFFGMLSFYLLVLGQNFDRIYTIWSAIFAGIAVGMKLTAIFITPLLGMTLIYRLWHQNNSDIAKNIAIFVATFTITAIACTAPALLLFPFFVTELTATYNTFLLFKNLGSSDGLTLSTLIVDGMSFYVSASLFLVISILFVILIFNDLKNRNFISVFIFSNFAVAMTFLLLSIHKGPIYIATYLLSLSFFIPFGLLAVDTVRVHRIVKIVMIFSILIFGIFSDFDRRNKILADYSFFDIAKSERVNKQFHALNEMRSLVTPLKPPVRILQDITSLFPGTRFNSGIEVRYCYGDLKQYSEREWGKFDYIALNSSEYYGKVLPTSNKDLSENTEEGIRKLLYDTGYFYGLKYRLIYKGNDTLLYMLASK